MTHGWPSARKRAAIRSLAAPARERHRTTDRPCRGRARKPPLTDPFVEKQQSRAALLLVVRSDTARRRRRRDRPVADATTSRLGAGGPGFSSSSWRSG